MWRFREWFKDELKERDISLRSVARTIGYEHNASRLSEYLHGKRIPGPAMVRQLAEAIDASPIEALWRAGYQAAFFDELGDLYKLGWMWCRTDRVSADWHAGAFFIPPETDDPTLAPAELARRYHRATIYHADEDRTPDGPPIAAEVTVPWPWSLAILIAIGAFPRRGDLLRQDHVERIARLAALAGPFIRSAQGLRMPENFKESGLLRTAKTTSRLRYLGLAGSAIVSEYMNLWADAICRTYTAYARLALFRDIGKLDRLEEPRHCRDIGKLDRLEEPRHWLEDHKTANFLTEDQLKALENAIT